MGAVELINGWISDGWLGPVVAAPFVGSFCGVLAARLPAGRGVIWGRSACGGCNHTLGVRDLMPLASFAALRGRCRYCGAPIGWAAPAMELAALCVAIWGAAAGERGALLWAGCGLGWTLLTLAWVDAVCLRLPDALTLPLLMAGLGEAIWLEPDAVPSRALGAAIGYSLLFAVAWAYRRLRGRDGLGLGDAKLLAAAGAWVGLPLLGAVILCAAAGGLLWALARRQNMVAFGPFLAGAIWLVWLYGDELSLFAPANP